MWRHAQLTSTNSPSGLFFKRLPLPTPINYIFIEICLGVHGGEGTPDPIPNSAVKLSIVDDTAHSYVGK